MEHNNSQEPEKHEVKAQYQTPQQRTAQLKAAQTLVTIAVIAGPVSFLFRSVLLSGIALACGIIAMNKTSAILKASGEDNALARIMNRQAKVAVVVSCVALAFNSVMFALYAPAYLEALLQDENMAQLIGLESALQGTASSASSVWG